MKRLVLPFALSLFFAAAPVVAQETTSAKPAAPGVPIVLGGDDPNLPVSVKDKTDKKAREALEKIKVSAELKGVEAEEGLMSVLKQIGVDYIFDKSLHLFGSDTLDLPERQLTMTLTKASAVRVLDTITDALGIGWWAEKDGGQVLVHVTKLKGSMGKLQMLKGLGVDVAAITGLAMKQADLAGRLAVLDRDMDFGGALSDKRVKLDATAPRDIRALIEDICKQAEVVYSIDSDVPATTKVIAFDNVPARLALQVVCASANLSYSMSMRDDKPVLRVSVKPVEKAKDQKD